MMIPFGEWLPDLPDFGNPGALTVKNVYPTGGGYLPFPDIAASSSNGLDARCQGAYAAQDSVRNNVTFAGDATKLYRLNAATFADVSKVGGYNIAAEDLWSFLQYGDRVIACNIADNTQSYTIASSSNFADLSATAPRAKFSGIVRDFVVFANTWDATDLFQPKRVWWSPIDSPAGNYTPNATTQSDFQPLEGEGGQISGFVGGTYGVVFEDRAIWRMTYVGSPAVFRFDQMEKERGTTIPGSIASIGNLIFFLADDGYYMFNGQQSTGIGTDKIDRTFFADLDSTYSNRITSAVDPINKLYMLAYPGSGSMSGNPNKLMLYYWPGGKWATVTLDTEIIYRALSQSLTLEDLDAISGSLDALPFSLDSVAWTGGKLLVSAFNTSHKLSYFNGSALTAVLETGERQPTQGRITDIEAVRPIIDGGSVSIEVGTRNDFADSNGDTVVPTYGTASTPNSIGECDVRESARYHRIRATISGGFTNASAVEFEPIDGGAR